MSLYMFVRGRQLEGTYSFDPTIGIWPITACRVAYGWGAVPENSWPLRCALEKWPPVEPPGLDEIALSFRSRGYQRICSLSECRQAISKEVPVMAAFGITNQWATAKNGVIEIPQKDNEIEATHTILLVGYDDSSGYLTFRNSWGTEWGDKGYGYLPYGYFESQLVSAWVMYYWRPSKLEILHSEYFSVRSVQLTCTKIDSIVGKALILFDLHDLLARKKIGWCFVVPRDDWLNVEEMFVVPSYRNKGYGKILCDGLLSLSSEIGSPLRLWISYADDVAENQKCVSWVSSYLRLHLRSSEVRWASLRAEPSKQQNRMRVKIECPSRPRSYFLTKNRE